MSFLIAEIVGSLLLAAACGAGVAYWWLHRRFVDVTAEYEILEQRAASGDPVEALRLELDKLGSPDLEPIGTALASVLARLEQLERKCDALRVAAPADPCGLVEVSSSLATLSSVVDGRISALEDRLAEALERLVEVPPEPEPEPPAVALEEVRREEGRNLLTRAAFGEPDDIEIIKGVGPKLRDLLHSIGVYYFWQIAAWTEDDVAYVDSLLEAFQGRIEREAWVPQAVELAALPSSARPPPGEGPRPIPTRS